jgi:hypothetical protein
LSCIAPYLVSPVSYSVSAAGETDAFQGLQQIAAAHFVNGCKTRKLLREVGTSSSGLLAGDHGALLPVVVVEFVSDKSADAQDVE